MKIMLIGTSGSGKSTLAAEPRLYSQFMSFLLYSTHTVAIFVVCFSDKILNTRPSGKAPELVGAVSLRLLPQTAPLLESPTGAFIASQPQHFYFRRKQKIRTLFQSETGSDFSDLVGAGGFEQAILCSLRAFLLKKCGKYALFAILRLCTERRAHRWK